jgi:hypothetical protein
MNIEAKKLSLIERFMKFRNETSIHQLELAITEIEMNVRAEASEKDILEKNTRSYDDFSKDVTTWLKDKSSK